MIYEPTASALSAGTVRTANGSTHPSESRLYCPEDLFVSMLLHLRHVGKLGTEICYVAHSPLRIVVSERLSPRLQQRDDIQGDDETNVGKHAVTIRTNSVNRTIR